MINTIKIDEVQYEFLGAGFERPSSFIRRFQQGKNRFYYTLEKDGSVKLYSSATTLIKDGYAEDKIALEEWRNKLRAEGKNPTLELQYVADRGTIMHALIGKYITGQEINLTDLDLFIRDKMPDLLDLPFYNDVIDKDTEWLQKAIIAFGQFAKDYKVKPFALELIMKSDKYQVASPIDMICEMEIMVDGLSETEVYKSGPRKGQPKEVKIPKKIFAIVDFKSTQSGFYDSHYLQLQLYKRIFEENYPNIKIEGLFNWSPKEWRSSPTYNLKDQSNDECLLGKLAEIVYQQGMIKHQHKEPTVKQINKGVIKMDSFDGENVIVNVKLTEFLELYHKQKK